MGFNNDISSKTYSIHHGIILFYTHIYVHGYTCVFLCSLQWRHKRDGVSNHQPPDCLFNCLFRRRSKKTSKLRVTGFCVMEIYRWPVNSPHKGSVTQEMFPFDDVIMLFHDIRVGKLDGRRQRWCISKITMIELCWITIVASASLLYTLTPRQNGRHFADDIFKNIFLNESDWISIRIWVYTSGSKWQYASIGLDNG